MMLYLLKSSVVFLAVILFYKIFLENEKAFVFNRIYLWAGLVFSILSPLIIFEVPVEWAASVQAEGISTWAKYPEETIQNSTVSDQVQRINYLALLAYSYIFLSAVLLIKFAFNLAKMIRKCLSSNYQGQGKFRIIILPKNEVPHSFFNYIFLPKGYDEAILRHEKRHASACHSLDVLLLEIFQVALWAHPLFYSFKKIVLLNHEFYADQQPKVSDTKDYQKLIFSHIAKNKVNSLASGFNYSFIKKRMIMLQRSKSGPLLWAKKLLVLPLFVMLLIGACEKIEAQDPTQSTRTDVVQLVKEGLEIVFDGKSQENVIILLAENNKEISKTELKQLIKSEGLVGYDKVNFKSGGRLYKGREISSIVYTEEKEELFMRKLSEGNGILKISTKANPNGQKYRAIKLGQNQNWGANYTGNEVPPPALKEPKAPKAPRAPKAPKTPKAKQGVPPPPTPPSVSEQSGILPPPPPPAPTSIPPPPPSVPQGKADLENQISYLSTRIEQIQENGSKEQQEELKELQTTLKILQETLSKMH